MCTNYYFIPGIYTKITKPENTIKSRLVTFPENRVSYIFVEFVKIYNDGNGSTVALSSDGSAYFHGKILYSLNENGEYTGGEYLEVEEACSRSVYQIIKPPSGEKYIDITISFFSTSMAHVCILLSDKGKCYGLGDNRGNIFGDADVVGSRFTTPTEIFSIPNMSGINQIRSYGMRCSMLTRNKEIYAVGYIRGLPVEATMKSDKFYSYPVKVLDIGDVVHVNVDIVRYRVVTHDGCVYQSYTSSAPEDKLMNEWGIEAKKSRGLYRVPGLNNIVQAHGSMYVILMRDTSELHALELSMYLDNGGNIYFLITRRGLAERQVVKGPYKLPNFNNIVKIFLQSYTGWGIDVCSYGFINMQGEAYVSIGKYPSVESLIHGIENPRLIALPPNLRAKDIVIDDHNIYLLLQNNK